MSVRRYRWHNCSRRHLSGRTFAACAFPDGIAIEGAGQWAVLACPEVREVTLHWSSDTALEQLERFDKEGCSPRCVELRHEIGFLDLLHTQRSLVSIDRGEVA